MSVITLGAVTSGSTQGTAVTPNASANTKGSYVEFTSSLSDNTTGLIVVGNGTAPASGDILLDIATGAASSETDVIANIPFARVNSVFESWTRFFPLKIASGSRIALRTQCSGASGGATFVLYAIKEETTFSNMDSIVTYGANTADSGGTSIDPGGTANTKGSWTEITSSTSADIDWLTLCIGNQANAARSAAFWHLDIGTGAAGAETAVIQNLWFRCDATNTLINSGGFPPLPVSIASGTRIAVRAQSSIIDATDRLLDVVLHGANGSAASGGGASFGAYIS